MPTLTWTGKDKVINHHQEVPFHVLKHQYGFNASTGQTTQETASGNKIIHGDNLLALKSLLPEYEGRIKCIYIDPPYNTGNEGWVYNDNVNDPKIKKWLGEVVGREGEDLNRHDKWLCMMYPRLKLLHKLLSNDGGIFISIDDNEHANLKIICDEIFGVSNHVTSFVWKRRSGSNDAKNFISIDHEYILLYQKTSTFKLNGLQKDFSNYTNPDNDPRGPWTTGDLTCNKTKEERPNLFFNIVDPTTGIEYECNPNRVWVYEKNRMDRLIAEGKVIFPKNKKGTPQYKRHLSVVRSDLKPVSSWIEQNTKSNNSIENDQIEYDISIMQTGINASATKELRTIFGSQVFNYSKPIDLISEIVKQSTNKNSIVLDSFSGSGTTAHAVLNLNKEDGGKRQFILVEMEDYAETITAERVRRVLKGYGNVEGTGGEFDYYELGPSLLDAEGNINEAVPVETIRNYVFYTETKLPLVKKTQSDNPYFLEKWNDTGYYFYYEKDRITVLDMEFLATLDVAAEQHLIYADQCLLEKDFLANNRIIFKKIPRDITRF